MNYFMRLGGLFLVICLSLSAIAQTPTVDLSLSPTQLVEDVLAGPGVIVSNAKFNGNTSYSGNQIGRFDYGGNQIPFSAGIVIGSGGVSAVSGTTGGIIGPNNNGSYSLARNGTAGNNNDVQLKSLDVLNRGLNDAGILEFDFVPSGNKVSFQFIFGSDEYNEYVCTGFYDVFGFFVNGPNPNIPGTDYNNQNLALVPGTTTPITINTINNGSAGSHGSSSYGACATGGLTNSQYFAGAPGNHFQMDGCTKAIDIEFDVVCGETYHFKFAIADVGDENYDSWVFLKAGSFQSEAVQVSVATVTGDNTIIEGCTQADIIFTRPIDQADTAMTVTYTLGGNAIEGVNFEPLPDPIQFQPGEDSIIVSLIPIQDGVNTGTDSVIITVQIVNQCGDTITSSGTIYIQDEPNLSMTVSNPTIYCVNDEIQVSAAASGASREPFTYLWSTGATTATTDVPTSIHGPFEYYVTATDDCGFSITDTVHINVEQTLMIDTLIASKSQACKNTASLVAQVHGVTGTPVYSWKDSTSTEITNQLTASNVGGGWYFFTVKDNLCEMTDSVFVETIAMPVAVINPDKISGCNPTTFVLSNASQNANLYTWIVDGSNDVVSNTNPKNVLMNDDANPSKTVYLIASNGTCADTTTVDLTISIVAVWIHYPLIMTL